jgi:SNF2 family DNA or RNA helicase
MNSFDKIIDVKNMEKKPYQRDGVEWLLSNEMRVDSPYGIKGGFVADEMGLGKTIMMIGLCYANFKNKTLIVVPPVLIDQWYKQIYRLTGHKCVVYHGKNKKIIDLNVNILETAKIVLCSYDAISIKVDKKDKNNSSSISIMTNLHGITWGRIIFDEAHHLRNKKTTRFLGAKVLRSNIKWLVSGTPVQNKKQDFYALCSLINLPISYCKEPSNLDEIARFFILRRTKKQVGIDLDDAIDTRKVVSWKNSSELLLAKEIHSAFSFANVNLSTEKKDTDFDSAVSSNELIDVMLDRGYGKLPLLLRARQSCIYPKMMENKIQFFKDLGLIKDKNDVYEDAMKSSSKLDSVIEAILLRSSNGNGKLVFCHFSEEMNIISKRLLEANPVLNIGILDGKTTMRRRTKMIEEKKDVLIMQIQTGCEGLNLQDNYSEIYFVSPHWNPYVEDQAIARCHRIGQKKPVYVWRFEMDHFGFANTARGSCGGEVENGGIVTKNLDAYVTDVQNGKRLVVSKIIE